MCSEEHKLHPINDPTTKLNFLELPTEVRVQIMENLNPSDLLNMRLVNQKTKKEVDEHHDFRIRVDQAYRGFRKLCRFRVNSCKISNLTHQHLQRGSLFSFPHRLKKLTLDGNISQANLVKILSHCLEIEDLTFTHETLGIANLLQSPRVEKCLQTNLNKVTSLNVQLLRYPLGDPFENETNMDALLSLTLPALKTFRLYFSLWGCYLKLFLFLQRHANTLEEVELQVGDRGDVRNTEIFQHSNRNSNSYPNLSNTLDMNQIKSLQFIKFNFRDDVLNLNGPAAKLLLEILKQQKRLQVLQFHSPGEFTVDILQAVVLSNYATLTEIVVYNLKHSQLDQPLNNNHPPAFPHPSFPLDMCIFCRCTNLKTLALSCSTRLNNGIETSNIKLLQLNLIPSSIERIHLTGFQMDLQDIIQLSRNSVNLKELLIADAGIMKYSTVLGCFLKNCEQLEYLNVRPVMTRANGDAAWWSEVEDLSKLYNHFMGIPFDPIDDLDGFEAKITQSDRQWLNENVTIATS